MEVMSDLEAEVLRIDLEHWKARALAAEAASEKKEMLLNSLTDAASREGRTIVAVALVCGTNKPIGMMLHSPKEWEADLAERWGKVIGPWLQLLDVTIREMDAKFDRERMREPDD